MLERKLPNIYPLGMYLQHHVVADVGFIVSYPKIPEQRKKDFFSDPIWNEIRPVILDVWNHLTAWCSSCCRIGFTNYTSTLQWRCWNWLEQRSDGESLEYNRDEQQLLIMTHFCLFTTLVATAQWTLRIWLFQIIFFVHPLNYTVQFAFSELPPYQQSARFLFIVHYGMCICNMLDQIKYFVA